MFVCSLLPWVIAASSHNSVNVTTSGTDMSVYLSVCLSVCLYVCFLPWVIAASSRNSVNVTTSGIFQTLCRNFFLRTLHISPCVLLVIPANKEARNRIINLHQPPSTHVCDTTQTCQWGMLSEHLKMGFSNHSNLHYFMNIFTYHCHTTFPSKARDDLKSYCLATLKDKLSSNNNGHSNWYEYLHISQWQKNKMALNLISCQIMINWCVHIWWFMCQSLSRIINGGFARSGTHLYVHDFAPLLGFLFARCSIEKNYKTCSYLWFTL